MDNDPTALVKQNDEFLNQLQEELQSTRNKLNEVSATINQSQNEFNRLTQIKANITTQLQHIQSNPDSVSKNDIRNTYNAAMDAQQRLLVMRGQLDKFSEQKIGLQDRKLLMERIIDYVQGRGFQNSESASSVDGLATLEMLITSQESERQRLSRQMHDGPAQALSNFIVQSEIASRMFEIDQIKSKEELDKLKNSAMSTFQKIRSFISELRPMMLDDLGLVPTIKRYINNLKEQTGVDINLNVTGTYKRFKQYLEVYLFRAMQELIGNSIKHNLDNASKIRIDVNLVIENSLVKVEIKDNGKGFNSEEIHQHGGLGLKLIQERAQLLGGSLDVNSHENEGTEIILTIPFEDKPGIEN